MLCLPEGDEGQGSGSTAILPEQDVGIGYGFVTVLHDNVPPFVSRNTHAN